jgi:hypothetical protein
LATIGSNEVRQYAFDVRGSAFTATLVWLRHYGCTNINNLDLRLRDASGELIARSESVVDNVEHIHVPKIAGGSYVLELSATADETYGLAFDFGASTPPRLSAWALSGEPNQRYLIESTTDFRTWSSWIKNTTSAAGMFEFSPANDGAVRFFRAVELP